MGTSQKLKYNQYDIRANIWLYHGDAAWHFITIPRDTSQEITDRFGDMKRGWGSLPVMVTLGSSTWRTSIFPDKKAGGYILPLKAEIRKKEGVYAENTVRIIIEIIA